MTQLINKIRFMHVNPAFGTRATIAYHRDENGVAFAWTELYHKDNYVKSVGREVSTKLLMENLKNIDDTTTYIESKKYGYITADFMIEPLTHFLADNLTSVMTAMDFKHATVSQMIYSMINDYKDQMQ